MLFNSLNFILFAAIFYFLWPVCSRRNNPRWIFIVFASFFFYGMWDWRFLFLLVGSGLVDYLAALCMQRWPRIRNALLIISLSANIGALSVFKYSAFLARNIGCVLASLGLNVDLMSSLPSMTFILPVGISFYTFQSMSYTIDVYRGEMAPSKNIFHFFAYLSMFPQLVAGPIVRASLMLRQLAAPPCNDEEIRWEGFRLIASGFFKKMVLADNLAPFVDAAFASQTVAADASYWFVIISMFSFQIYYDFSGYSDIARGLIKWMGYDIDLNFDHPYTSSSLREFWQRWHISLSTWFRDYVYIPLGGSRGGVLATSRNLWISFLLSGLWHGAAWTFVIWGGMHAFFLNLERMLDWPSRLQRLPGGRIISTLLTLMLVGIGWVFFRSESLEQALTILGAMLGLVGQGPAPPIGKTELVFLGIGLIWEFYFWAGLDKISLLPEQFWCRFAEPLFYSMLLALCVLFRGTGNAFIYFQF